MKKVIIPAVFLLTLVFNTSVFAAGYGTAGCGLGSMVFGDDPGLVQVFAVTSNNTGIQTFGITSGTSNCDSAGIVLASKEQEVFVEKNYTSISKEMAVGSGENLNVLASLLGCSNQAIDHFGSVTQKNHASITKNGDHSAKELLNAVKGLIKRDGVLSSSCSVVL